MSGLLDLMGGSYGEDDPRRAAAIALFAGLLGGKGNLGGIVSDSITGAQKSFLLNREAQQRSQENQAKLEEQRRQAEEQRRQQQQQDAWRNSLVSPTSLASQNALAGGGGPTVANAAKIQPVDPYSQVLHDMASSGVIGPAGYSAGLGKVLDREDAQTAKRESQAAQLKAMLEKAAADRDAAGERKRLEIQGREDLARLAAGLRAPPAPEPLVEIDGPDGKPIWATRSQAVGQPVARKTGAAKPLPDAIVRTMRGLEQQAEGLSAVSTTFKPEYGGAMGAVDRFSGTWNPASGKQSEEAANWWKTYENQAALVERHEKFGTALSKSEQGKWQAATIAPGMKASVIANNLKVRKNIANKLYERTREQYNKAGYPLVLEAFQQREVEADDAQQSVLDKADAILRGK